MLKFWTRIHTTAIVRHAWGFSNLLLASSSSLSRTTTTSPFLFGTGGIMTRCMSKSILKTNKSAAKRFRVTGNGSIRRSKAGRSHNTGYKSRARKNNLATSTGIRGKAIEKRMRQLIGA